MVRSIMTRRGCQKHIDWRKQVESSLLASQAKEKWSYLRYWYEGDLQIEQVLTWEPTIKPKILECTTVEMQIKRTKWTNLKFMKKVDWSIFGEKDKKRWKNLDMEVQQVSVGENQQSSSWKPTYLLRFGR